MFIFPSLYVKKKILKLKDKDLLFRVFLGCSLWLCLHRCLRFWTAGLRGLTCTSGVGLSGQRRRRSKRWVFSLSAPWTPAGSEESVFLVLQETRLFRCSMFEGWSQKISSVRGSHASAADPHVLYVYWCVCKLWHVWGFVCFHTRIIQWNTKSKGLRRGEVQTFLM